jgi:hypothetical protein
MRTGGPTPVSTEWRYDACTYTPATRYTYTHTARTHRRPSRCKHEHHIPGHAHPHTHNHHSRRSCTFQQKNQKQNSGSWLMRMRDNDARHVAAASRARGSQATMHSSQAVGNGIIAPLGKTFTSPGLAAGTADRGTGSNDRPSSRGMPALSLVHL